MAAVVNLVELYVNSVIAALTILGNIFVIMFFCAMKKDQQNERTRIKLSMAYADLIGGFLLIVYIIFRFTANESIAMIPLCVDYYLFSVSLYHLSYLTFLGEHAIKNPIGYTSFDIDSKSSMYYRAAVWILPILPPALVYLCASLFSAITSGVDATNNNTPSVLPILYYCTFFILPYAITLYRTLRMYQAYHRNQYGTECRSNEDAANTQVEHDSFEVARSFVLRTQDKAIHRKFIKMISLIIIGYSITCLPNLIFVSPRTDYQNENDVLINNLAAIITLSLQLSVGLIDVIVYILVDADFRKYIINCFC